MNTIIENIKTRRSVRRYQDRQVSKDVLEQILEAGRYAPSALNKQPWEFVVVSKKEVLLKLSQSIRKVVKRIYALTPFLKLFVKQLRDTSTVEALRRTAVSNDDTVFYDAPAVVFVVSDRAGAWVPIDCSLAVQNMMLAAHSLGVGSCFIGRGKLLAKDKSVLRTLGIQGKHKIYATLIFGYPNGDLTTVPERKTDNVLAWIE